MGSRGAAPDGILSRVILPPMEEHALSYEDQVRLATEQTRIAGFVLRREALEAAQALISEIEAAEVAAMQARVRAAAKV